MSILFVCMSALDAVHSHEALFHLGLTSHSMHSVSCSVGWSIGSAGVSFGIDVRDERGGAMTEARSKAARVIGYVTAAQGVVKQLRERVNRRTWPGNEVLQDILLFCGASGRFLAPKSLT